MPKKNAAIFTSLLVCGYIISTGSSNGRATQANAGNTGAPGETQTCSNCHSGGNYGTVTPLIQIFESGTSVPVTAYRPGAVYDISLTVQTTAGTPGSYGFQMTALTSPGNSPLSGYSNLASNVKQKIISSSGRTYVEQNGVGTNPVFAMKWTAPVAGTGTVKFYGAGNAVNGNRNDNGDKAGVSSFTLAELMAPSVTGIVNPTTCNDDSSGTITLSISGGTSPYFFLWNDNSTDQNRSGLPADSYSVTVTDAAGMTASLSFNVQLDCASSIHNTTAARSSECMLIFPNPANDWLEIFFPELSTLTAEIIIYNTQGVAVGKWDARQNSNGTFSCDISALASSVYYIRLKTDRGDFLKKFIKL